jgi:hypothetical protein
MMKTLTIRIDASLDRWLTSEAKRNGSTKSEVVRQALLRQRTAKKKPSVHDLMRDVCGVIKDAPRDLSSNLEKYLTGFGE